MDVTWITSNAASERFEMRKQYANDLARKGKIRSRPATAAEIKLYHNGKMSMYALEDIEEWARTHACARTSTRLRLQRASTAKQPVKPVATQPATQPAIKKAPLRDRIKYILGGVDIGVKTRTEAFDDIITVVMQEPHVTGWNPQ